LRGEGWGEEPFGAVRLRKMEPDVPAYPALALGAVADLSPQRGEVVALNNLKCHGLAARRNQVI
jgi:hypothetical protein